MSCHVVFDSVSTEMTPLDVYPRALRDDVKAKVCTLSDTVRALLPTLSILKVACIARGGEMVNISEFDVRGA